MDEFDGRMVVTPHCGQVNKRINPGDLEKEGRCYVIEKHMSFISNHDTSEEQRVLYRPVVACTLVGALSWLAGSNVPRYFHHYFRYASAAALKDLRRNCHVYDASNARG